METNLARGSVGGGGVEVQPLFPDGLFGADGGAVPAAHAGALRVHGW